MSASAPGQTVYSIGYDFHLGNGTTGADNGNVFAIYNYRDRDRDQAFTYDALNRVTSAQNAGTECTPMTVNNKTQYWGNSYDAWGNLLNKVITKCGAENLGVTADAHNWIHATGLPDYQYDAAGNMTYDATAHLNYSFDQENRITGASGYTYTYDSDGNRVSKSNGTLAANGTLYWYMTPGIVAESDLAGTTTSEYVFFGGERVARRDGVNGAGGVFYYFSDHLKTASVITDAAGTIKAESDYYPWGGELQFINNDSNHYKFTGKERDSETGLDYFGVRYYSNGLARWVSADWSPTPIPVPYANFGDPQSLNQYGYTRGLPTTNIDPDGHGILNWVKCSFGNANACAAQADERKAEEKKQAIQAYADISGLDPSQITINGQTPQQFVQGKTSKQLIDADHQITEFLASLVQFPVQCDRGVSCGVAFSVGGMGGAGAAMDAELAETSGILREASRAKGNSPGLGNSPVVTQARAQQIGEAWVGPGWKLASDGRTMVSADGLRTYRPPTFKPKLGITQANLEQFHDGAMGKIQITNYHITIK